MIFALTTYPVLSRYGKSLLLAGFIILGVSSAFSQTANPVCEKLAERLQSLAKNSATELVYIQTSKGIYETSEDLWFKAYLLDAQYFAPSPLSKTLYLQLINESSRRVVWQEKYEAQNGFATGHVFLSDSLSDGNYLLVAFTQRSFFANNEELKAVRRILVKKVVKPQPIAMLNTTLKTEIKHPIQFTTFSEGGNLVAGIPGKLAFKAVSTEGLPVEVQGTLLEDSVPLVKFKSTHAGMGSLTFAPLAGKKYRIHLSAPDTVFCLPEVMPQGITLQLTGRDKESLEFKVSQSPSFDKRTIYLRGQVRGVVCCMATATLNKELKIKMPLKEFPCQGIAEFTLFTDSLVPVAERLVYVHPEKRLNIEAHLDKDRYQTRGKVLLKIKVTDDNGQPVVANLGINVYDKLYRNVNDPQNILSHCFLSSQLKGKIYDPSFYFDTKNKDREEALDLLLLTQGWRRYVWGEEALQANNNKNQSVVFDGIRGEVHATRQLKKAKRLSQLVMVFNPGKNDYKDFIEADTLGNFIVTPRHLKLCQGGYVHLKPMTAEEFKPRISIAEPFVAINEIAKTKAINYPLPALIIKKSDNTIDPLVEGHGSIKLAEVMVKGRGIATFRDKYMGSLDSIAKFNYNTDYVCWECGHFSKDRPPGKGMILVLNCKFHTTDQSHKPVEGKMYGFRHGENLANDTYKSDEFIVYHNSYLNFTEEQLLEMNNLSRIKAYYVHREFYEPKYDNPDSLSDSRFDFRNTLLWKPMVVTDERGEATLEFFCSNINTRFVGNIEGVSGEGLLGKSDFEFSVYNPKLSK